jgi:hypothetical protein
MWVWTTDHTEDIATYIKHSRNDTVDSAGYLNWQTSMDRLRLGNTSTVISQKSCAMK